MAVAEGGTTENRDYYGVDKTWFSGATWSRPVFDGEHLPLVQGHSIISLNQKHNIVIDNIEIKRHLSKVNWGPEALCCIVLNM